MLVRYSRMTCFNTTTDLLNHLNRFPQRQVSRSTAVRRLRAARIYRRVGRRKTLIRAGNRTLRIRWTTRTINWTVDNNWRHIVFSDESRFNLSFDYGRVRCWRTNEEAYNPEALHFRSQSTTSVTVLACTSIHSVGQIVVVDGKMDDMKYMEVLGDNLLDSV